jgi:hypothetical protein
MLMQAMLDDSEIHMRVHFYTSSTTTGALGMSANKSELVQSNE